MRTRKQSSALNDALFPIVLGGVALIAADLGRRLFRQMRLFCPSRQPLRTWNPKHYGIPDGAVEEVWFDTPDGETLYGWYCRAENPVASSVFCHGNTGNLTTSADTIPHLLRAGFNVLFFDYRGYGRSSGRASFSGVISDGITAAKFHDTIRPQHLPSILYGYSLGGAVAAHVVRRHPFDALILHSTFSNLPDLARVTFPHVPMHLIAGHDVFDTVASVRKLHVPLLVLHGTHDETCPCWMGETIYEACPTSKRMHLVDGGLHKDLFIRAPEEMVAAITDFINELPRGPHEVEVEETPMIEEWTDSALRSVRRWIRGHRIAW